MIDAGPMSSSPESPIFQSLSASPTDVGMSGTTISAIVTDPQGISDLAGGTVIDKSTGTTYGAFGTPGGQGTFVFTLTWTAMNDITPIDDMAGSREARTITARFFDNEGNTVSQDLTLKLACDVDTQSACSGTCFDLTDNSNNCGSCGYVCKSNATLGLNAATCATSLCTSVQESTNRVSCTDLCAASGATCSTTCTDTNLSTGGLAVYNDTTSGLFADSLGCTAVPAATDTSGSAAAPFVQMDCCCIH